MPPHHAGPRPPCRGRRAAQFRRGTSRISSLNWSGAPHGRPSFAAVNGPTVVARYRPTFQAELKLFAQPVTFVPPLSIQTVRGENRTQLKAIHKIRTNGGSHVFL